MWGTSLCATKVCDLKALAKTLEQRFTLMGLTSNSSSYDQRSDTFRFFERAACVT